MIEIRRLSVADYDAICDVWRTSGLKVKLMGRESRESFVSQMATGLQTVIGAVIDGTLVGVALTTHDGRKGWINRLGVRPEYQRKGVATALIREAERSLHEQGITVIAALVEYDNEASLGVFQKEGFQINDVYYLSKRDHPNA